MALSMPSVHNKYHNTAPEGAVYIGRPSPWGNPFTVQAHGRDKAVELYREWLMSPAGKHIRERARKELQGKELVCFCKPKACHGDWLLEVANYEDELDLSGVIVTQKDLLEMTKEEVMAFEQRWKEMLSTPMSPDNETNQETQNDQKEGRQRS